MKRTLIAVLIIGFICCSGFFSYEAAASSDVIFAQERIAIDSSGNPYPIVSIKPDQIQGMKRYQFDLDAGKRLAIETNGSNVNERGLDLLAKTVSRCYRYIEKQSGKTLHKGIRLYLIELDKVPYSYKFEVTLPGQELPWAEVRLILIQKGAPLYGNDAPSTLTEMLYDTLPHELGHDIMAGISTLQHDIEGQPSFYTRWFIEGACELLAKGFAHQEFPHLWRQFLADRNVDSVLGNQQVRNHIYKWTNESAGGCRLESDLYGASLLLLMHWTEKVNFESLLKRLTEHVVPLDGARIVKMMETDLGLDRDHTLDHAWLLGQQLTGIVAKKFPAH